MTSHHQISSASQIKSSHLTWESNPIIMFLLEYTSEALILLTLYLISEKFLMPVVFLPLSNKVMNHWGQKKSSKKRRRTRSAKSPMPVKRLSGSYFVVDDSSTLVKRSTPTDSKTRKRSDSTSRKWSLKQAMKTPRNQRTKSGDSSTKRMIINSLKNVLAKTSPKYIYSKLRKIDLRGNKPLPLRIIQLRRGLYWFIYKVLTLAYK